MAYIKGLYIQDIYSNPQNGYLVGLFRVKETDMKEFLNKVITFTGTFAELKYKTTYHMTGNFTRHNKYGMQFQVDTYEIVLPTEEEELIEFLSSDLFPIGEKTAEKIVQKFGKDTLKIITQESYKLYEIPRLSEAKIEKMVTVLEEYEHTSKIVLELNKLGFNTKTSISILKKYHNDPMPIIENNIYNLKEDLDISFDELDKIALNNGYLPDDERRVSALTINLMNLLTFDKGDTYLYFDAIYDELKRYIKNITSDFLGYILLKLSNEKKLKIVNNKYYLLELYDAEVYIANRLSELNNKERRKLPKLENKINQLELSSGITYDDSQKSAIVQALNNNLTIITGGPGTGKTTIVKCIVNLLININGLRQDKLALLAPTGRAARKLMETTKLPAYTIHKYLKWDKEQNEFAVNEYCPNQEEYIIIDESSMIDTILMASLLKGITKKAKIILVGDYYQLPSVGQGQVLKDLIDSNVLDVVKLNKLYRQTEDSYINSLAYEIKNKDLSENFLSKYDDYNFITCTNEQILPMIEDIVKKALQKGYSEKDIQVLAPIYKTQAGIDSLNKVLQNILNPFDKCKNEISSGEIIYREGDKILQLVNDSDNGISNGDLGYIESIVSSHKSKSKKNEIIINFDGLRVTYTPKDFINITHGYAISVHKSQGGEFKMVIMPFSNSFRRMLYNKLVYTAITRAKEKLILVGDPSAFINSIRNDYQETRKTTLKELLENKYK